MNATPPRTPPTMTMMWFLLLELELGVSVAPGAEAVMLTFEQET